jgi:hypothetical protein
MKLTGRAEPDLRPSCLETTETAPCVFACARRVQWQATFLDLLCNLLATLPAQPDLRMILVVGTQGALQDDPLFGTPVTNCKASFELPVSSHKEAGQSRPLRGRFSHHWVQTQQECINREEEVSSKKFTGQCWLQKVLNHLQADSSAGLDTQKC